MSEPASGITLYNWPTSTCSQKVRMCLSYKGLAWRDHVLDWRNDEQISPWYLALNPNGVVPTLVHDGVVVRDSSVINEYLEDVFPDKPLLPRDAGGRARVREWRQYIDEVPTASIRIPSMNSRVAPAMAKLSEAEHLDRVKRRTIRRHFYARMGREGFPEADVRDSLERLRDTVLRMEAALLHTAWLAGDDLSLADISVLPTLVRMEDTGLDPLWADCERVGRWYGRIQALAFFALAFPPGARHERRPYRPDLVERLMSDAALSNASGPL